MCALRPDGTHEAKDHVLDAGLEVALIARRESMLDGWPADCRRLLAGRIDSHLARAVMGSRAGVRSRSVGASSVQTGWDEACAYVVLVDYSRLASCGGGARSSGGGSVVRRGGSRSASGWWWGVPSRRLASVRRAWLGTPRRGDRRDRLTESDEREVVDTGLEHALVEREHCRAGDERGVEDGKLIL